MFSETIAISSYAGFSGIHNNVNKYTPRSLNKNDFFNNNYNSYYSPSTSFRGMSSSSSSSSSEDLTSSTDSLTSYRTPKRKYIQKPIQKGKRCGVIFVDTETDKSGDTVYSFIVVMGKKSCIYSFPKGRMSDENENEEECAIREVYEETGIKLKTTSNLPRISLGRNIYFIYHVSKYVFSTFNIQDTYEVGTVGWMTTRQLEDVMCNKDLRIILNCPNKGSPHIYKLIYHHGSYINEDEEIDV